MQKIVMVIIGGATLALLGGASATATQADPEEAALRATALDYIEGWYAGDADRMARAVHPELVKRIVRVDPSGKSAIEQMGASGLVLRVALGGGKKTPPERQQKDVTVLDHFGNAAVVKIVASDWVDYLQEAKVDGRWRIVNVLWELKPRPPGEQPAPHH